MNVKYDCPARFHAYNIVGFISILSHGTVSSIFDTLPYISRRHPHILQDICCCRSCRQLHTQAWRSSYTCMACRGIFLGIPHRHPHILLNICCCRSFRFFHTRACRFSYTCMAYLAYRDKLPDIPHWHPHTLPCIYCCRSCRPFHKQACRSLYRCMNCRRDKLLHNPPSHSDT